MDTPHQPPHTAPGQSTPDLAADLIRQKINSLYAKSSKTPHHRTRPTHTAEPTASQHKQFRDQLSGSGKSLAEIQTAWYRYYSSLPDHQKHEVWQEFYHEHQHPQAPASGQTAAPKPKNSKKVSVAQFKDQLAKQINAQGKLSAKHHLQSLMFGLACGSVVVLLLLFSFFNERIIAPFITPSRTASSTPIIVDANTPVSSTPEVIIPKINVEIPVVYGMTTVAESAVENELENGVVHYATTPMPGQQGNAVFFGHSSNNILNKGKYKFAFVLLHTLQVGDTFMLTNNGKRYTYQIYQRQVVDPSQVSVLGDAAKPNSATLITCDPPGTSLKRLVVTGQQISPDPASNTASTAIKTAGEPTTIPSNAPTLWSRLTSWL